MKADRRGRGADLLPPAAVPVARTQRRARAPEEAERYGSQQDGHATGRVALEVDDLDKRIAAALQISPRAHWRQIAAMAGTSESTARRHAERMVQAGLIRVTATADALSPGFPSLVQFTCDLPQVGDVAWRLAERGDIRFVSLVTGRFDVVAELIVPGHDELARIILQELPTIPGIRHTTTETVLYNFKTSYDWSQDLLDPAADQPAPSAPSAAVARAFSFDPTDRQLISFLRQNGRMSYADLAARCGISEPMARRRVETLIGSAGVRPVTFVNPHLLGYEVELLVWLRVDLSQLEHIAAVLAARREVRYLSATSGFSDLVCEIILSSHAHLYSFLTGVLGTLPGIRQVDTATELRTLKRAFVRTGALASPAE